MPSVVSTLPFIPLLWAEPMVKQACSRRDNHMIYIASGTPYMKIAVKSEKKYLKTPLKYVKLDNHQKQSKMTGKTVKN